MREATLGGLSDLDTPRPRRPGAPRGTSAGPSGKGKPASGHGAFGRLRSRATMIIATAGFSAIMVGIVVNAVVLQKGHHPAPLFGSSKSDAPPAGVPRPLPRPEVAPVPMATPVTEAVAIPPAPVAPPASEVVRSAPRQALNRIVHHSPKSAARPVVTGKPVDRIAGLIRQSGQEADPHAPLALHPVAAVRTSGNGAKVRPGQKSSLTRAGLAHRLEGSAQATEKKT